MSESYLEKKFKIKKQLVKYQQVQKFKIILVQETLFSFNYNDPPQKHCNTAKNFVNIPDAI